MSRSLPALALALTLLLTASLLSAPAPLPRLSRTATLKAEKLAGPWILHWGNYQYDAMLSRNGVWSCRQVNYPGFGYQGTWRIEGNKLLIWEVSHPESTTTQHYVLDLDPLTLSGTVAVGCPGVSVRLTR